MSYLIKHCVCVVMTDSIDCVAGCSCTYSAVFVYLQLWTDVSGVCLQEQCPLHSGEQQATSWQRIRASAFPWERTRTRGSSFAMIAEVISTTTLSAFALENATTATFTEELLKEPERKRFHPSLCSCENWRCPPETEDMNWGSMLFVVESQTATAVLKTLYLKKVSLIKTFAPIFNVKLFSDATMERRTM